MEGERNGRMAEERKRERKTYRERERDKKRGFASLNIH